MHRATGMTPHSGHATPAVGEGVGKGVGGRDGAGVGRLVGNGVGKRVGALVMHAGSEHGPALPDPHLPIAAALLTLQCR